MYQVGGFVSEGDLFSSFFFHTLYNSVWDWGTFWCSPCLRVDERLLRPNLKKSVTTLKVIKEHKGLYYIKRGKVTRSIFFFIK